MSPSPASTAYVASDTNSTATLPCMDEIKEEMAVAMLNYLQGAAAVCADVCLRRLQQLQDDMQHGRVPVPIQPKSLESELAGSIQQVPFFKMDKMDSPRAFKADNVSSKVHDVESMYENLVEKQAAPPLKLAGGSVFEQWLAQVDPAGALGKYATVLDSEFDSVDQIEDVYLDNDVLDQQFFEDIGLEDEEHKGKFHAWFSKRSFSKNHSNNALQVKKMPVDTRSESPPREEVKQTKVDMEERRTDPDDGKLYTLRELRAKFQGAFSPAEIEEYWSKDCQPTGSCETPSSVVEVKVPKFHGEQCDSWLQRVDNSGSLLQFQAMFEANFDSVAQVQEACAHDSSARSIDSAFFADLGINSPSHQKLFNSWFLAQNGWTHHKPGDGSQNNVSTGSCKESMSLMAKWLKEVDPSGSLLQYTMDLEENFDSIDQIDDLYVKGTKFDPLFFSDVGIEDESHKAMIEEWFIGQKKVGDKITEPTMAAGVPCASERTLMVDWLKQIDPTGSLSCYADQLEDNYDAVDQIEDLYLIIDEKGKRLDPGFFDDAGIDDPEHRAMFEAWFLKTAQAVEEERRIDPDDNKGYTLSELHSKYKGSFSTVQVEEYWASDCQKV